MRLFTNILAIILVIGLYACSKGQEEARPSGVATQVQARPQQEKRLSSSAKVRTLRIAAVQMESRNGLIKENLERATVLIEEAALAGAELILLPEFMPTGYIYSEEIWDAGEATAGLTVNWLRDNSKRLGVWLGTSFLEAEGEDFYNTFVLTSPDGLEAGRVRKRTPAVYEAFYFRGDTGPHVIDTALGRIGVGICYDNHLAYIPRIMYEQSADLLLMPHSAPSFEQSLYYPREFIDEYNEVLRGLAQYHARGLGIPAILCNKAGLWKSPMPGPMPYQDSRFPGLSSIADSDGSIVAQMGSEEGVIVAEVTLDPSRKSEEPPPCFGRWAYEYGHEPSWSRHMVVVIEYLGHLWYSFNSTRKTKAREITSQQ